MDNIKNDKTEKEIEKKVSEIVKKDIEKLLSNKEDRTPSESLGSERREALSGGTEKNKALKEDDNRGDRYNNRRQKTSDRKNYPPLKDLREKDKEERKAKEKFQSKLSKINRRSVKNIKKNIKEKSRKIAERKKVAFKKKLKEKMKKKLTMNAKEGKSTTMSLLFTIFLFIALFNDSVDIVVGIISWAVTATGVGVVILAITEILGDIIDIITTILLVAFSFYVGGSTKSSSKGTLKSLARIGGAFVVELIPLLNLFTSWIVVTAWNWHDVRKRASEAEKMDEKINRISGS